mgnify:CR=1 FL=1
MVSAVCCGVWLELSSQKPIRGVVCILLNTNSMYTERELEEKTGLLPGSVSPFGLLNNKDADVIFCLDREFMDDRAMIGIHPNENTATVWLKTEDLIEMIKNHGNEVRLVEL